jgi:hypothetical protein
MKRLAIFIGSAFLVSALGCDTSERVARLEKQNQELQAEIKKGQATANYDLQAKCSKDAREWFNEHWTRDKDTIFLDFTNHYSKAMNKCFIVTEFHYYASFLEKGSWMNDIDLTDVYENNKYGNFTEKHEVFLKPEYHFEEHVQECQVNELKCKTLEEFRSLTKQYMDQ